MKIKDLFNVADPSIRVLHFTWLAFYISFFTWFNMAPIASTMLRTTNWLTPEHLKALAILNVALTIPARILVGAFLDRFGPRLTFSALLVLMAIPATIFAFADDWLTMALSRLVLSCIGASFVIGIRMVSEWFPPKHIGFAEGFYAGWGNFGSAAAAMTLPIIALQLFGGPSGWRYALALSGAICLIYGIVYYFAVKDCPEGKVYVAAKKTQPMEVSTWSDLVQLILWSFPLVGAMGVLAWRLERLGFLDARLMWISFAVLLAIYIAHVFKVLQVNVPILKKGVPPEDQYRFTDVAALNTTYIANFGAELAVVSMLPSFFETTFSITPALAGAIAASFAFVNLFARPFGGWISDQFSNRRQIMLAYMLGIALGFFSMGLINSSWPLALAVAVTVFCSLFVQGAEGATFAIIPLIKKRMTGQIAGMAGAYGNVGAVLYLTLYSYVTPSQFFFVLAGGAFFSFLFCLVFLREPPGAFSEDSETPEDSEKTESHRPLTHQTAHSTDPNSAPQAAIDSSLELAT